MNLSQHRVVSKHLSDLPLLFLVCNASRHRRLLLLLLLHGSRLLLHHARLLPPHRLLVTPTVKLLDLLQELHVLFDTMQRSSARLCSRCNAVASRHLCSLRPRLCHCLPHRRQKVLVAVHDPLRQRSHAELKDAHNGRVNVARQELDARSFLRVLLWHSEPVLHPIVALVLLQQNRASLGVGFERVSVPHLQEGLVGHDLVNLRLAVEKSVLRDHCVQHLHCLAELLLASMLRVQRRLHLLPQASQHILMKSAARELHKEASVASIPLCAVQTSRQPSEGSRLQRTLHQQRRVALYCHA
mmetsp:Transcript_12794/g.51064  ORF Transcript_12794/g.51064 Transcript_12794/m.51064 type:complete len:299 (+) Transcript_12794:443-1339(+)